MSSFEPMPPHDWACLSGRAARWVRGAAAALVVSAVALPVWADPPDPAKVRLAADQFDLGSRAFKAREFEVAASAFEAADAAVPSAKALRFAIRARSEAGQGSRAATLAAQALSRYPDDRDTTKLARDTLEQLEPVLHRVDVSCASPCVLAIGTRAIPGQPTTRWVVYLDPGPAEIGASFFGNVSGGRKPVDAKPGGKSELRFEPEEPAATPVPAPAPSSSPKDRPAPEARPEPAPTSPAADDRGDAAAPDAERSGLHPAFFIAGAVVTAGLGGVTIWSGIATQNDPGPDVVREQCRGKGPSCPAYQEGLAAQTRTNVLLGATAGTAALTIVVGAFFTDWGSDEAKASAAIVPLGARGAAAAFRGSF